MQASSGAWAEKLYVYRKNEKSQVFVQDTRHISLFNQRKEGFVSCIFSGTWIREQHDRFRQSSGSGKPLELPLVESSQDENQLLGKGISIR